MYDEAMQKRREDWIQRSAAIEAVVQLVYLDEVYLDEGTIPRESSQSEVVGYEKGNMRRS